MAVRLNENKEIVERIKEGLKKKDGYCPCKLTKSDDTKCPCKEFREQEIEGYCHCGRYYKDEVKSG